MKKTILIIDDFETTLFTVGMTLTSLGFNVLKAGNANDALLFLDGRMINFVISDFNMPGMNGIELTKQIRKMSAYKNIPILMLSTEINPDKKKEALNAGVMGWVKKPFDLIEFKKLIQKVIQ